MFEETMFDASIASLITLPAHRAISISDHVSRPRQSERDITCAAPFLACRNSIMQGADGVPRCNSPFLYCDRYVNQGASGDAGSSSATKNLSESMIGTK